MAAVIARLLLPLALLAAPAGAQLTRAQLDGAVARPAADARLPGALRFTDQRGARVTLAQVAGGRPLVLLFADYTCRHICGPGLALTAAAIDASGLVPGRDVAVAVIGLDPKDSAADAQALARQIASPAVVRATLLLRGDPATIARATRALGYGYGYDAGADQFAHDASVYVFARDGRFATLLPELALTPATLRAAVTRGAAPPSFGEQVARLCYGLAAAHGRYGRAIVIALQAAALALLAGAAWLAWRRRRVV